MFLLDLRNLHLDTKTIILRQLARIVRLFLQFLNKMAAILDFAWLAALDGVTTIFLCHISLLGDVCSALCKL